MPFPTALKSLFSTFSVLSKYRVPTIQNRFGRFDAVIYQENILSSWVFRRETASGFYPWGNVEGSRKRVAEGLYGWRHGNSFPMTQSAQSLRQMRSIPHCSKAVFYVFVFDSIHDSTTMHNLSPHIFHWTVFIHWTLVSLVGIMEAKKIPDITIGDCLTN